jgi:hypothetical protein
VTTADAPPTTHDIIVAVGELPRRRTVENTGSVDVQSFSFNT